MTAKQRVNAIKNCQWQLGKELMLSRRLSMAAIVGKELMLLRRLSMAARQRVNAIREIVNDS